LGFFAVFQAPKRRPRVYEAYEAPLPAPRAGEDGFSAELVHGHVVVRDPGHVQALYGQGYFGKGVLSRSRPRYSVSERWGNLGDLCLPIISSSRYKALVKLAQDSLLAQGLEGEAACATLEKFTRPVEQPVNDHRKDRSNGRDESPQGPERRDDSGSPVDAFGEEGHDDGPQYPPEAKRCRRQGDPHHDPLAKLYPEEPERVDGDNSYGIKCVRHDDWIAHCGCRVEERQLKGVLHPETDAKSPDQTEYVLVEEEEEQETEESMQDPSSGARGTLKLVCRANPFRTVEYLQLSLEEAFFLVYALGCLSIYYNKVPLSIVQLWTTFSSVQPNFNATYAAYHYFRSKGWVPKTGVKYGTDFMLYRKGPPFYHASYSVVVEQVNDSFQGATLRPFSWRSLAALSRITGNVSKELMVCFVITPLDVTEELLSSPDCIKRFRVQEMIVSRWISSRERTEQDDL
uniref:tRNA-splicing endonuclease subunit Sen2 n=1 Tax=Denticeps clupeoides TaxID=299321 RepID=A0AAY4DG29_9TELE